MPKFFQKSKEGRGTNLNPYDDTMELELGACRIFISHKDRVVTTRFVDGVELHAAPDGNARMMAELGYDDEWRMCVDHEVMHSLLADVAGLPCSPTLWRVAHPGDPANPDDNEVALEEARVFAAQREMQGG